MSSWLAGERMPWEQRHVQECGQCAAEIEDLEAALGAFRAGLRATPSAPRWSPAEARRRNFWQWTLRAAAVATAALVVVAVPAIRSARERERAEQARADTRLLEQVQMQLSRSAPVSLEPALELVSWEQPQAELND